MWIRITKAPSGAGMTDSPQVIHNLAVGNATDQNPTAWTDPEGSQPEAEGLQSSECQKGVDTFRVTCRDI